MKTSTKPASTQEIMARMAGRMDALLDAQERVQKTREAGVIPDELRFWMAVDPLLADLHKQFLDARACHARLLRMRGRTDAMTDVANDMVDSAQCAFETRLLELRRDEESRATVLALMRRAHDLRERESHEAALAASARFWRDFARPKGAPRPTGEGSSFWMVLMGLMVLRQALCDVQRDLSIAATFGRASNEQPDPAAGHRVIAG